MLLKEAISKWGHMLPPPGSKGLAEARLPLTQYVEVGDPTAAAWLKMERMPTGQVLLRLCFFLESLLDVTIDDDDVSTARHPDIKALASIIGAKLLTVSDVSVRLGFGQNTDSVLRLLKGSVFTSSDKLNIISMINQEYADQVKDVRSGIRSLNTAPITETVVEPQPVVSQAVLLEKSVSVELTSAEEALLLVARMSMVSATDMMEQLISSTNPLLRDEFRRRNQSAIARHSRLASALTSEKARDARIADGLQLKKEWS